MADFIHALLKWVDHNRYLAASLCVAAGVLVIVVACEPKAKSPFTHEPATQGQLLAQVKAYQAQIVAQEKAAELTYQQTLVKLQADASAGQAHAQAALDEITQRKQAITLAVETLTQVATAAAGPGYAPLISTAAGIAGVMLGLGAAADSRRKDQVILDIQSQETGRSASDDAVMN